MLRKIGRLFTIKTRFEAWLVIYAIAVVRSSAASIISRLTRAGPAGRWRWHVPASCSLPGPSCSIQAQAGAGGIAMGQYRTPIPRHAAYWS